MVAFGVFAFEYWRWTSRLLVVCMLACFFDFSVTLLLLRNNIYSWIALISMSINSNWLPVLAVGNCVKEAYFRRGCRADFQPDHFANLRLR